MAPTINMRRLRAAVGSPDKIPATFEGRFENVSCPDTLGNTVVTANVTVVKSKGGAKHRVYLECPTCEKQVPAGRWQQHNKTHPEGPKVWVVLRGAEVVGAFKKLDDAKRKGESLHTPHPNTIQLKWESDDPDLLFLYGWEGTKWTELAVCIQQTPIN